MTESPSAVADFLVRSLKQVEPRSLKGSELSVLTKTVFQDFRSEKYGCRTLREFIRKNAPEIIESSRAGMDYIYLLKDTREKLAAQGALDLQTKASPLLGQLTRNPRLWKTFTSPESSFRLYLDPQTSTLRAMYITSKPLPHWKEIPRISAEFLLQIGKDFTATLDDVSRSVLSPLLLEEKWWIPYFERLQGLGIKSKWIVFRRERIYAEFERIVAIEETLPLAVEPIPDAIHASPKDVPVPTASDVSIRTIAADVVQRMTESELRGLNLPLGYVMDFLQTR